MLFYVRLCSVDLLCTADVKGVSLMAMSLAQVVESRRKSVSILKDEIATWDAKSKALAARSPAGAAALDAMVKVRRQRLVKLEEELKGLTELLSLESSQLSIPGAEASVLHDPPAPGAVTGRGSGRR